jgi:hypothetical protein
MLADLIAQDPALVADRVASELTAMDGAAVEEFLESFAIAALVDAPPGTSVEVRTDEISATLSKVNLSDSVGAAVVDTATASGLPVRMSFSERMNAAPVASNSVDFAASSTVPALQLHKVIDVAMIVFTSNPRGNGNMAQRTRPFESILPLLPSPFVRAWIPSVSWEAKLLHFPCRTTFSNTLPVSWSAAWTKQNATSKYQN